MKKLTLNQNKKNQKAKKDDNQDSDDSSQDTFDLFARDDEQELNTWADKLSD